jgi:hypothetical protein
VNENIQSGSFTILVSIDGLGPDADYNPLPAKLYIGGGLDDLGTPPKFDGTDAWPLFYEFLNNGDKNSPKVSFANAYLTDNTFVSGSQGDLTLSLSISGFTLNLKIAKAVISMDLNAAHDDAVNGIISGIIPTEDFVAELKKVAGAFDPGLCSGSTVESIANQVRQSSDILKDGTQDPSKDCDGITIGLGFTMSRAQLGDVLDPAPPSPDPCAAGGAGGAGG